MTKKEAIIKYISEMNTEMLSLLLDDDKSYMDVSKELFVEKIGLEFDRLKNWEINEFSKVIKGHCGGDCNNGCEGYRFLTSDNQALDLIVEEKNNEIRDIYTCNKFIAEEINEIVNDISWRFYDDEKTNYIPSSRNLILQKQIDTAYAEFNQFKNNVTDIETFCNWSIHVENLYDTINIYERVNYKFTEQLHKLAHANSYIQELITLYPIANKAMKDFKNLNVSNESELIEWVLKYDDNELFYGDYKKVNNWEQNNLILHALDNSIVLDCSKYTASLHFSEIHPKYAWELYEKYKTSSKQFNEAQAQAQAQAEDLQYNLRSFLNIQGTHQQLDIIKTGKKPIYLKYIIGKPEPTDQFIVIAGNELGINVKSEQIGTAYTFKDDNGITQIESSPKQTKNEIENKKADKFYSQEIGLDWKSKFQNKIIKLFKDNQVDECPF